MKSIGERCKLSELKIGQKGVVQRLDISNKEIRRHLLDMGLTRGVQVKIKKIAPINPDVIINIVDSTSLERSLYLTTQLLELDCKVIVALNMADILEEKGLKIKVTKLQRLEQ